MRNDGGPTDCQSDSAQIGGLHELLQVMLTKLSTLEADVGELRREARSKGRPRPFLSLREAARRLGVSRNSTLADLIGDRRVKTVRINGKVKVPAAEVERLIREATR